MKPYGYLPPSRHDSPLQAAKDRLLIPEIGALMFPDWTPGKPCRCPWREDRNPSFSVYDEGRKWKDFGTGEGGDAADFIAAASGISQQEGAKRLIQMAGILPLRDERKILGKLVGLPSRDEREPKRKSWPQFDFPTEAELKIIMKVRGLSEGIYFAASDEVLQCAESREGRAWVLTDCNGRTAQARLLSGRLWAAGMKAKTLPGAEASWPIGIPTNPDFSCVALVEGGPDMLAAYDIIWRLRLQRSVIPVAMLGAANRIPDEALQYFDGKRVRIFAHEDKSGKTAWERWSNQLYARGVNVDGYEFSGLVGADGKTVKDLNDFARMAPSKFEQLSREAFDFASPSSSPPVA